MREFDKEEMRARILGNALKLSDQVGYDMITRPLIASMSDCSEGYVSGLFGGMDALKEKVLSVYIERRDLKQIARALVARHPLTANLDQSLKASAALSLAN